ncbi:MAG: non-hydrolyzing UDP-N-acetylglucosamine 2-epimerase, partial [Thermoleophilia bacterium]
MKKFKTMTIFGTRPEVIKLAPVIQKLDESPNFESILVTTGQHREMLGQALGQFGINPHYNLDIMQANQGVSDVTVNSLIGIEELITEEQPDLVIVQGDTTTAFAGCLAAFYQKIPVAHVEAGLRTYDKYRPFPEEINRSLITQLADLHFVPTATAWEALRSEGIPEDKIFITGNTVIDALFHVLKKNYEFNNDVLGNLQTDGRRLIVVTSHRRENFGQPILDICDSIARLVTEFSDIEVVFSVHRNPKVNVPVREKLSHLDRVHLVDPLDYMDMANLIAKSYMVLTDSGGLQEEAPALAKPVLVMRDVTERPEAVQAGMARMVGTSPRSIFASASELLNNAATYSA